MAAWASAALAQAKSPPATDDDDSPARADRSKPAASVSTTVQGVVVRAPNKAGLPLLTEPAVETPQTISFITEQMIQLGGARTICATCCGSTPASASTPTRTAS